MRICRGVWGHVLQKTLKSESSRNAISSTLRPIVSCISKRFRKLIVIFFSEFSSEICMGLRGSKGMLPGKKKRSSNCQKYIEIFNPTKSMLFCIILIPLQSHQVDVFGSWGVHAHPMHPPAYKSVEVQETPASRQPHTLKRTIKGATCLFHTPSALLIFHHVFLFAVAFLYILPHLG